MREVSNEGNAMHAQKSQEERDLHWEHTQLIKAEVYWKEAI